MQDCIDQLMNFFSPINRFCLKIEKFNFLAYGKLSIPEFIQEFPTFINFSKALLNHPSTFQSQFLNTLTVTHSFFLWLLKYTLLQNINLATLQSSKNYEGN